MWLHCLAPCRGGILAKRVVQLLPHPLVIGHLQGTWISSRPGNQEVSNEWKRRRKRNRRKRSPESEWICISHASSLSMVTKRTFYYILLRFYPCLFLTVSLGLGVQLSFSSSLSHICRMCHSGEGSRDLGQPWQESCPVLRSQPAPQWITVSVVALRTIAISRRVHKA